MKVGCFSEDVFRSWMCCFLNVLESSLKHVSLTESLGKALDFVGYLILPDIKEWLPFFHDLFLEELLHSLDLSRFPVENHVLKGLKIGNTIKSRNLTNWAHGQLGAIVGLFLVVS